MKFKKIFLLSSIIILLLAIYIIDINQYISLQSFKQHNINITNFIQNSLITSIIIFSLVYVLIVALSIPGASFMTIIGGYYFGTSIGVLLTVFSATAGALIFFIIAKYSMNFLVKSHQINIINKMRSGFQKNSLSYILTLRVVPLFPFVIVNMAAAFFNISFKNYIIGTFIGIIPGTYLYTSIGSSIGNIVTIDNLNISNVVTTENIIILTVIGVLMLTPAIYNRYSNKL